MYAIRSYYAFLVAESARILRSRKYLGEIVEWGGWALLTWSPTGLAFFVWTVANLAPRAWSHHRWYHEKFPDYPVV